MNKPFSFGFKIKPRDDIKINDNRIYMTCVEDGHNKFYEIFKFEEGGRYLVGVRFGRIGVLAVGNVKNHGFDDEATRDRFFLKKFQEKLKRGYKPINRKA